MNNGLGNTSYDLTANTYTAIINYTGSDVFNESYVTKEFTVKPALVDVNLTITAENVKYGEDVVVVISTNNTYTGSVFVKIGDANKTASVENGRGNVTFSDLTVGTYNITALFSEDETFLSCEKNATVDVAKGDSNLAVTVNPVYEGSDIVVSILANKLLNDNVTVKIGDDEKIVEIINGTGKTNFTGYANGTYTVNTRLDDNNLFESIEVNATVNVSKKPVDPNLAISVSSITQGANAVVKITTNNTFTGNVVVRIANKNYNVAVKNGAGTVSVSGLGVGTYSAVATFVATSEFTSSVKSTTFKVNKKADVITLTLKSVSVKKSAKKLTLQATLKINKGAVKNKQIVFMFNGKTLKAKTNSKGVAKVTVKKAVLKKLKVGKKITYTAKYSSTTVKKTAKVKK